LQSNTAGASVIPVTKIRPPEISGQAPAGWVIEKKAGAPSLKIIKDGENYYMHLISNGNSSFGARTATHVDVKDFPIITWRWKVNKLPVGGDVRRKATDDQAVQLYVAFKSTGFPAALNTPIIGYIWDNEAPRGWTGRSSQVGGDKLRYIVLRNKTDKTGQWFTERRNIYEDYKKLFREINGGEPMGVTSGVQVYINTQRTKAPAEGLIGDIYFSSATKDIAATEAAREVIVAQTPVISAPWRKSFPGETTVLSGKDFSKPGCINVSIEFDFNSIQFEPIPEDRLQTIIEYLVKYPQNNLVITGHTDNIGSEADNLTLSLQRAAGVKQYLVDQYKIDSGRLIIQGAGEAQPIGDNSTPEGRRHNRRALIQDCPE